MTLSCLILITTVLLTNKVSLEVTVTEFIGDFAILPCFYRNGVNQVNSVFWRHNDSIEVCEFNTGSTLQGKKNNSRVEFCPEDYKIGNYTIKINDLIKTDAGVYTCFITPAYYHENIHLNIEDRDESPLAIAEEEKKKRSHMAAIISAATISVFCLVFLVVYAAKKLSVFKSQ